MKLSEKQQRQTYLMCGLTFLVLGISMMGTSRAAGIPFVVVSLMFFALSAGVFGKRK